VLVRIGAGEIDHQIGARGIDDTRQCLGEQRQICVVAGVVRQLDVEITGDFVKRVVPAAVHAEREDAVIVGEHGVRSVSLVHVEIDDGSTVDQAIALQGANRDRDVIEDAEPFTVRRKGVMRAAGQVHRDAVLQCGARRFVGSTGGAIRPFDQRERPGKAKSSFFIGGQGSMGETVDVIGGVHEQQILERDACRIVHAVGGDEPVSDHALAQTSVFDDRESVPFGQREAVARAGPDVE